MYILLNNVIISLFSCNLTSWIVILLFLSMLEKKEEKMSKKLSLKEQGKYMRVVNNINNLKYLYSSFSILI